MSTKKMMTYFLTVILLVFIGWKLYLIKKLLIWFLIAIMISLITKPIIHFLQKKWKLHRIISVSIAILILSFLFISICSLVVPLILNLSQHLSSLDTNYLKQEIIDFWLDTTLFFRREGFDISAHLSEIDFANYLKKIPLFIVEIFSGSSNFIMGIFCVSFISFFLIKENGLLRHIFFAFVPQEKESQWENSIEKINKLLSRYLIGVVFQISILFVFYTVLLFCISAENPFSIAAVCALLNLIPFVGPLIGYFLMILLTISNLLGADFQNIILPKIYIITGGYALAQLNDNFLVQPLVFSKSVRSHPLEIFLVITASGLGFGVFAMVLSVPFYTALKVIIKIFFSQHPIVKKLFGTATV